MTSKLAAMLPSGSHPNGLQKVGTWPQVRSMLVFIVVFLLL